MNQNKRKYRPRYVNKYKAWETGQRVFFFIKPNKIFARIGPNGEPIEIPSTWRYMVPLKLKETDG